MPSTRLLFGLAALAGCAGADASRDEGTASADSRGAGERAIGFYQRFLGEQWAYHCDFQPSCSNFGLQSIHTYGLGPGVLMTADRLMRDHRFESANYPSDELGRPYDPPAADALFGPRADDGEPPTLLAAGELERAPLDGDLEQFRFAVQLFEARDFERARVEFERLLFHHPDTRFAFECRVRIALCFARTERPQAALAEIDSLAPGPERERARALVLREKGRTEEASAAADTGDAAGTLLAGLLALEADDSDGALRRFTSLPDPLRAPLLARVDELATEPRKSPALAGALSAVLPGSGQFYAGRNADAAVALITNALLIGGTVAAAHEKERVTAVALGTVALGFYLGNVYGGVNAATRFNRVERERSGARTRGWLRQSGLLVGLEPDLSGGVLGLYLGF